MPYKKIGEYGVIGNGATIALVGRDGALDWMCLPFMDSPSVFAAILDDANGGRFSISPDAPYDSSQVYLPHTNVLQTRFRTAGGELELTDFMVANGVERPDRLLLMRRAIMVRGRIGVAIECSPRFDYARRAPAREVADGGIVFSAAAERLALAATRPLEWNGEHARADLAAGDVLWLVMGYGDIGLPRTDAECERLLDSTRTYWRDWLMQNETWRVRRDSFWQEQLDRAAVVRAVARHLYDRDAAARIERDARRIRIAYAPYDWRLNR